MLAALGLSAGDVILAGIDWEEALIKRDQNEQNN